MNLHDGGPETILVVDDNGLARKSLGYILESFGYHVETAESGAAAVEFLRARSADLVVLDVVMEPDMDGVETYRRIVEEHPGQRAIVMTGLAEQEQLAALARYGLRTWVWKPLEPARLAEIVRRELDAPPSAFLL